MSLRNIFFDLWYRLGKPDWDIDQPQPDLIAAASGRVIRGPTVLDVGCGKGDNAIYLAERGFKVTGVDVSKAAIVFAKRKALAAGLDVEFMALDAFQLGKLGRRFDTVIDYGLFHQFDGEERSRYVNSLRDVCKHGGLLLLQCFSDQGGRAEWFGPRLISQDAIRVSFASEFQIEWIRPATYKTNGNKLYPAWLALMTCGSAS